MPFAEIFHRSTLIIFVLTLAAGCASISNTLTDSPRDLSASEAARYDSISSVIEGTTGHEFREVYGWYRSSEMAQPYQYAKNYCESQEGQVFRQTKPAAGKVPHANPNHRDREVPASRIQTFNNTMRNSFGEFECQWNGVPHWLINISLWDFKYIFLENDYKQKVTSSRGWATVRIKTIDTAPEIAAFRSEQIMAADQLKAQQLEDQVQQIAAREAAAAQANEQRAVQEKAENERRALLEKQATAARSRMMQSLALGTETHCGMVVQLRENLIQVQTSAAGDYWFKPEQLQAPGFYGCTFWNGEYMEPE